MKIRMFFLGLSMSLLLPAIAQHCPFDGTYAVVVHLSKKLPPGYSLKLERIPGPETDSCKYGKQFTVVEFLPAADSFLSSYTQYGKEKFKSLLKKDHNFVKGNQVVLMGSGERTCMIDVPGSNDYRYIRRQFKVVLRKGADTVKETVLPDDQIWSLCGSAGSWKRIHPVELSW